jgi:hypothetical protein
MVIVGIIFIVIAVILAIVIILLFKTNLGDYYLFLDKGPDISEYDYLFNGPEGALEGALESVVEEKLDSEEELELDEEPESDSNI